MKRKLIIAILTVITLIALAGCKHTGNVVTDNPITIYSDGCRVIMEEWISPDGVHYWFDVHHGCFAPRYDHDGNLIIDEVMEGSERYDE